MNSNSTQSHVFTDTTFRECEKFLYGNKIVFVKNERKDLLELLKINNAICNSDKMSEGERDGNSKKN